MDPVQEQLEAYNEGDLERFLACYAEGVVVEDGRGSVLMTGIAEMREAYAKLFETSPDLHCRLLHRIRLEEHVVDEEEVTGLGNREPGAVVHAVAVYRLEAGRIAHVRFLK